MLISADGEGDGCSPPPIPRWHRAAAMGPGEQQNPQGSGRKLMDAICRKILELCHCTVCAGKRPPVLTHANTERFTPALQAAAWC